MRLGLGVNINSGKAQAAVGSPTYPSLWKFSANFAHSSAVATHVAGHGFNGTENTTAFVAGKGVQEDVESVTVMGSVGPRYGGGFSPASLPSGAVSGTLQDGATGPGGVIDLATDKYVTLYFEIVTIGTQPSSNFFNEFYWGNDDDTTQYNGTAIAGNIVRKTGELKHKGTPKSSGAYAAGEFISVSYNMESSEITQNGGSGTWEDNAILIKHLGPTMGYWVKEANDIELIFHGYVLSSVNNTNEAIASIDLPIAVS